VGTYEPTYLGRPRLTHRKPRRPRQLKLFEKENPGESVQVDVKHIKTAEGPSYQYTALDDCTRYRVLRLYRRCNEATSVSFLRELRTAFPFPIQKVQTDNGAEFSLTFALSLAEAGIKHRYIRPRCPQQNGKVERSHRIDNEEFWSRHDFSTHEEAWAALSSWENVYNHHRFSMALSGRTPAEKLASRLVPTTPTDDRSIPSQVGAS
jgi:transposase InsO family protein